LSEVYWYSITSLHFVELRRPCRIVIAVGRHELFSHSTYFSGLVGVVEQLASKRRHKYFMAVAICSIFMVASETVVG
jgi:hypothetical protein